MAELVLGACAEQLLQARIQEPAEPSAKSFSPLKLQLGTQMTRLSSRAPRGP